MQVLILAAGYGTRLYPLTKDTPKPLLPCHDRPIIDYLLDKVKDCADLSDIIVVTNDKFYGNFKAWAKNHKTLRKSIQVFNDKTTSPEDRLGAMGDIDFILKKDIVREDLLVMGGDNLFDYELDRYIGFAKQKNPSVTIGLYDIREAEQAKIFGVVQLDNKNKVISFEEKPKAPKSTLIAMCLYYIPRDSFHFVSQYLGESQKSDTTGDYIHWLMEYDTVYGFKFSGKWYDIGSIEAYKEAQMAFESSH